MYLVELRDEDSDYETRIYSDRLWFPGQYMEVNGKFLKVVWCMEDTIDCFPWTD